MVDMVNHFDELDNFVLRMKEKFIARRNKHNESDPLLFYDVKVHLINEIAELFTLNEQHKGLLFYLLSDQTIDEKEAVDLANLCFVLDFSLRIIKEVENE